MVPNYDIFISWPNFSLVDIFDGLRVYEVGVDLAL